MKNKLKRVVLSLSAGFVLAALSAGSAQAVEFHSSATHTILSGTQSASMTFSVGAGFGNITCTSVKASGTSSATTEKDESFIIETTGCKDSVAGRTVHSTSGVWTLTPPATSTGQGEIHITKEATKHVTSGGGLGTCHIAIPVQTVGGVTYHNVALGDWEMTVNLVGVDTVTSGGFFNCGLSDGAHTSGTYSGTLIVGGTDTAGANANITVS